MNRYHILSQGGKSIKINLDTQGPEVKPG